MHGIGGNTIAEAKCKLSYAEFVSWTSYIKKRGSLNIGMRVEFGSALLMTGYANMNSKNGGYTVYDFMPHEKEQEITLDEAMQKW